MFFFLCFRHMSFLWRSLQIFLSSFCKTTMRWKRMAAHNAIVSFFFPSHVQLLLKITFNLYFISLFHYLDLFSASIIKLFSMTCLCNDFFSSGNIELKNEIQCDKQSFSRERCERTWDVVYVFIVRVRSTKKCFCNASTMVWRVNTAAFDLKVLSILTVYLIIKAMFYIWTFVMFTRSTKRSWFGSTGKISHFSEKFNWNLVWRTFLSISW